MQLTQEKQSTERQVNDVMSNGQDGYYETQIKEYEDNLNRTTRETQQIQVELAKLEEENILHDNKTKMIINSLKHDYETEYQYQG